MVEPEVRQQEPGGCVGWLVDFVGDLVAEVALIGAVCGAALLAALAWRFDPLLATAGVAVVMGAVMAVALRAAKSAMGAVTGLVAGGAVIASIYLAYCGCR